MGTEIRKKFNEIKNTNDFIKLVLEKYTNNIALFEINHNIQKLPREDGFNDAVDEFTEFINNTKIDPNKLFINFYTRYQLENIKAYTKFDDLFVLDNAIDAFLSNNSNNNELISKENVLNYFSIIQYYYSGNNNHPNNNFVQDAYNIKKNLYFLKKGNIWSDEFIHCILVLIYYFVDFEIDIHDINLVEIEKCYNSVISYNENAFNKYLSHIRFLEMKFKEQNINKETLFYNSMRNLYNNLINELNSDYSNESIKNIIEKYKDKKYIINLYSDRIIKIFENHINRIIDNINPYILLDFFSLGTTININFINEYITSKYLHDNLEVLNNLLMEIKKENGFRLEKNIIIYSNNNMNYFLTILYDNLNDDLQRLQRVLDITSKRFLKPDDLYAIKNIINKDDEKHVANLEYVFNSYKFFDKEDIKSMIFANLNNPPEIHAIINSYQSEFNEKEDNEFADEYLKNVKQVNNHSNFYFKLIRNKRQFIRYFFNEEFKNYKTNKFIIKGISETLNKFLLEVFVGNILTIMGNSKFIEKKYDNLNNNEKLILDLYYLYPFLINNIDAEENIKTYIPDKDIYIIFDKCFKSKHLDLNDENINKLIQINDSNNYIDFLLEIKLTGDQNLNTLVGDVFYASFIDSDLIYRINILNNFLTGNNDNEHNVKQTILNNIFENNKMSNIEEITKLLQENDLSKERFYDNFFNNYEVILKKFNDVDNDFASLNNLINNSLDFVNYIMRFFISDGKLYNIKDERLGIFCKLISNFLEKCDLNKIKEIVKAIETDHNNYNFYTDYSTDPAISDCIILLRYFNCFYNLNPEINAQSSKLKKITQLHTNSVLNYSSGIIHIYNEVKEIDDNINNYLNKLDFNNSPSQKINAEVVDVLKKINKRVLNNIDNFIKDKEGELINKINKKIYEINALTINIIEKINNKYVEESNILISDSNNIFNFLTINKKEYIDNESREMGNILNKASILQKDYIKYKLAIGEKLPNVLETINNTLHRIKTIRANILSIKNSPGEALSDFEQKQKEYLNNVKFIPEDKYYPPDEPITSQIPITNYSTPPSHQYYDLNNNSRSIVIDSGFNELTSNIQKLNGNSKIWATKIIAARMNEVSKNENLLSDDIGIRDAAIDEFLSKNNIRAKSNSLFENASKWEQLNKECNLLQKSDIDNLYQSYINYS